MKVIKTNWVNILMVFTTTYFYVIGSVLIHSGSFLQAILGGLISVCLYGMMFWGIFIVSLIVLDFLIIVRSQDMLKFKLFAEWLLISIPFIYWTIRYDEWIFAVGVISFLVSQLIRERFIKSHFA